MWYSLKFSTAMNRLQTGWVILMAASTTKRGPLRFSLVFFSETWVYIQLHPTRGGNCGNLCSQLFTAQLQGFLWTQVGQMLVASWCRKCSQGSKMKQFLSMSFCSVVWGPGEHSNIQIFIYIYIFGAKSSGDVATMLGCFSGSKSTLSCILQSSHFMHSTMSKWYGVGHETEKDYDHDQQVNLTSTSAWIIRVMGSMVCFCCQSCHRIINP